MSKHHFEVAAIYGVPATIGGWPEHLRPIVMPTAPNDISVLEGGTVVAEPKPIPMLIWCPMCCARHIDEGEFATKVHTSHSCQKCGLTWRPCVEPTVGVQFLPGFKNEVVK